jgi:hypothetical protein
MGRNTFDIEQTFKAMDREAGRKAPAPKIEGDYEIEATGLEGWMAFRYQYKIGHRDLFGYAETMEEARANIIKGQEGAK